ncbi:putative fluoride ion transporter CrcB 2 [Alicyclobacillus cellulosilyticus]|uniref:Fluoride-specific ion channel FluC n=1 Tax=Alicyclobacillus cellulosilyticus TaxID=1003997 RepID=A0A917KAY4_9BACL|nr:fluoride efflux transporter CrcB [Alicyclobacillus cellulosilyticus]GGJ06383.1 putative fluoride ion transporter CrcB 2 [Alicyclobacillus cellulosilyticus]
MTALFLIGCGGILGALARYGISKWLGERMPISFPLATLLINVSGSCLLGLLTRHIALWFPAASPGAMLFAGVGFCGAYTTFSTFAYEMTMLWREGRFAVAALYLGLTFVLGMAAAAAGLYL